MRRGKIAMQIRTAQEREMGTKPKSVKGWARIYLSARYKAW